jgi:hypothetical protein
VLRRQTRRSPTYLAQPQIRLGTEPPSSLGSGSSSVTSAKLSGSLELGELRSGAIQLTGLLMLAPHLDESNEEALLTEARGKKQRQLERLLAQWFPRPDVPPSVQLLVTTQPSGPTPPATRPGANDAAARPKLEPL